MVTITKQRRHIFLVETKRTLNADLQVVKFAKVVFVPNRSNYTGRIVCLDCERESLPEKPPLWFFKALACWGTR